MDYSKIYIELMERSFERELDGYVERHHIIPKCMGGDDKERNLAILTPEEHYLAHQLLVKIYPKNHKLIYATNMMCMSNNYCIRNNKMFGWIKRKHIQSITGKGNPMYGKLRTPAFLGKKHSDETKKRMSDVAKMRTHTIETRKKIGDAERGERNHNFGNHLSEETRSKIAEKNRARFGKKISQYSKSGDFIKEWNTAAEAGQSLSICRKAIAKCCRLSNIRTACGFIWKYTPSQPNQLN